MDRWTELRTAYLVARLGTVSAAAAALGVHRATVNRHIDALEAELGDRIFLRHARGYTPTDLGQEVLRVAQKTDELIEDLAGRAQKGSAGIEGEIKVTVLPGMARVILGPVSRFRAENPGCRVTVIASEDLERLEYGEAHVAVRAGPRPDHPDYVVRALRRVAINLYAHDIYVARKGLPRGPADLDRHEFVMAAEMTDRLPFRTWVERHVRPDQIAVASRNLALLGEAVLAGLGLGFLSDLDAAGRSDLTPVLPPDPEWSVPLWLVTHVDLHRTGKVQAMLRHIRASGVSEA